MIARHSEKNNGQAMTEFLICSSFALIPLFLGIALLAKYIDIKQAAIQAARYQAWEYTVWYADSSEPMTGFNAATQPIKSTQATQSEARRRFFSDPWTETAVGGARQTLSIRSTDAATGWTQANRNRLWTDHRGTVMYNGVNGTGAVLNSSAATPTIPIIGDVMKILMDIVDFAFSAIGTVMGMVGSSVGFTAINTEGYVNTNVSMAVAIDPRLVPVNTMRLGQARAVFNTNQLNFTAAAGVMSDAWNAGGVEHVYNQAGGAVPTVLLKELINAVPGLSTVWNAAAILAPELRLCNPGGIWGADDKGSLWLGHIDIDAVHPDRLEGGGTHECNDAGMCDFVPNIPRTEESRTCIE
jgi:hypothetical protein